MSSRGSDGGSKPRHSPRITKGMFVGAIIGMVIIGALIGVVLGLQWLEDDASPDTRGDANLRTELSKMPEIEYKGERYRMKRNLTTILFMGIDQFSTYDVKNSARHGGQADFLRLMVIDQNEQKIHQIAIDRDTLTPITILGVTGNNVGKRMERISLSHGFGDGKDESCQFTVDAASELFMGVPIDFYLALNMDGISELNDWIGGVTVTLEDDFSHIDPAMEAGATITLQGDQAEVYVRERMSVGVGTNEARMVRQQNYLDQLETMLKQKLQNDDTAAENLYDSLETYFQTNMSRGRVVNEVHRAAGYELEGVVQPTGEHMVDEEGFMQFTVNNDSVNDIVVSVFYDKV